MDQRATGAGIDWEARQIYWRRRLSRLRFDAEPIEVQIERYRRATWAISAVLAILAFFFICLFGAFGRPGVGAIVVAVLLLPVLTLGWLDFLRLRRGAAAYLRERNAFESQRPARPSGGNGSFPPTSERGDGPLPA